MKDRLQCIKFESKFFTGWYSHHLDVYEFDIKENQIQNCLFNLPEHIPLDSCIVAQLEKNS